MIILIKEEKKKIKKMDDNYTRFRFSPYFDQNVTLHEVFCPVCLLKTEHEENGGEYKCNETAGFTVLGFSTRWSPKESIKGRSFFYLVILINFIYIYK